MLPAIEKLPRIRLGSYPTPLTEAPRLSYHLGGPRILIKREDLSGLAMGGNKCRMLEFVLAEARRQGADAVISTASSQSNFCLQLAAAARRLGMKPSFVLVRGVHVETQGNLLLQNILDSDIRILETSDIGAIWGGAVAKEMAKLADDLRSRGYKPFIVSPSLPDISPVLATAGWTLAADELITQLKDREIEAQYVVVANGGGNTQGGLVLGSKCLKASHRVMGIAVLLDKKTLVKELIAYTDAVADFLGLGVKVQPDDFEIIDSYLGEGYARPTREAIEAIRLVAQTEGIFLDPVYTGKAMAGLIDLVQQGRFKRSDTVVFIHTGGIPALFAYHQEVAR